MWSDFFTVVIALAVVGAILTDCRCQWRRRQARLAAMRRTGAKR